MLAFIFHVDEFLRHGMKTLCFCLFTTGAVERGIKGMIRPASVLTILKFLDKLKASYLCKLQIMGRAGGDHQVIMMACKRVTFWAGRLPSKLRMRRVPLLSVINGPDHQSFDHRLSYGM